MPSLLARSHLVDGENSYKAPGLLLSSYVAGSWSLTDAFKPASLGSDDRLGKLFHGLTLVIIFGACHLYDKMTHQHSLNPFLHIKQPLTFSKHWNESRLKDRILDMSYMACVIRHRFYPVPSFPHLKRSEVLDERKLYIHPAVWSISRGPQGYDVTIVFRMMNRDLQFNKLVVKMRSFFFAS